MATDEKISQLTSGDPAQSSDLIPIDRSGSNFKLTAQSLANLSNNTVIVSGAGVNAVNNTNYVITSNFAQILIPDDWVAGNRFSVYGANGTFQVVTNSNQSMFINGDDNGNSGTLTSVAIGAAAEFYCTDNNSIYAFPSSGDFILGVYPDVTLPTLLDQITPSATLGVYALGIVNPSYVGPIVRITRFSDNAQTDVMADIYNRYSIFSLTSDGPNVADWIGSGGAIITWYDQSGNQNNATGGAFTVQGNFYTITNPNYGVGLATTNYQNSQSFTTLLPSNYTGTQVNVFCLTERLSQVNDTSMVTLYDPANGDDYATPLDLIAFHEVPSSDTNYDAFRNGSLSVNTNGGNNLRQVFTTSIDGSTSLMTIEGVDGTSVATSGPFSFNTILINGRYVSGQVSTQGNCNISAVMVFGDMSGGDIATVQNYIDTYL